MASRSAHWRPFAASRTGLLPVLLLSLAPVLSPSLAHAQAGANGIYYSHDRSFNIPFTADPGDRRIRQVLLYASEDVGKTYQYAATAPSTARMFQFQARGDGWYWFTVQTEDQDGRRTPADLSSVLPGLKVCVDTRPPIVSLRAGTSRDYPAAIEWDVRDELSGLDLMTLRAAYRPAGVAAAPWIDLPVQQVANGQQAWTPAGMASQYEVRLQVRDKAGNIGESLTTVSIPGGRVGQGTAAGATPVQVSNGVVMVNKKRIHFNYKIDDVGPSKVRAIEIWWTQERGVWQKYPNDAPPDPPYEIDVADEGRYGFTLVAVSGVGHAEARPQAGDPPQIWVQVDLTPPVVQLIGVDVGTGVDKGTITIRWRATDKFLAAQPITISYGTADGQWVPIASNIANDGRYVWHMPEGLPYQFPIKVDAVDQAGNIGSDKTLKDVIVDLSIPKARVIAIEGVKGVP